MYARMRYIRNVIGMVVKPSGVPYTETEKLRPVTINSNNSRNAHATNRSRKIVQPMEKVPTGIIILIQRAPNKQKQIHFTFSTIFFSI